MGPFLFLVNSASVFRSFQTATCVCLSAEMEPLRSVASDLGTGERNQTASIFCLLDCLPFVSHLCFDTLHPCMFLSLQGVRRRIRACSDREPLSTDQQVSWSSWFSWSLSWPEAVNGKPRQFALYVKLLSVCSSALHSTFSLRVKATCSESTGSQKCIWECPVMQSPHVGSLLDYTMFLDLALQTSITSTGPQFNWFSVPTLLSEDKRKKLQWIFSSYFILVF